MTSFEAHPLHPGEGVPTFVSAGIIKYPAQLKSFLHIEDPLAAPALTLGSFTWDEWAGNGEPNFVYYPDRKMAGNAIGLQNPGREGLKKLAPLVAQLSEAGIKTIVSITNLPSERAYQVVPKLAYFAVENVGATAIEVNLSCHNGKIPGTDMLHPPLASDVEASIELLYYTRAEVGAGVVLGIKDSSHTSVPDELSDATEVRDLSRGLVPYIDFATGINTIGNQEFPEITVTNGRGGMSGPVVAPVAKSHLALWRHFAPTVAYLSVGGVDSENADTEIPERLDMGAMRVGGAQEFYRSSHPVRLAAQWAIASA